MTDPDQKPVISQQEASWAETAAALKARASASRQGGDPQALNALLIGGVDEILFIAGKKINPPAIGQLMLMQKVNDLYATHNEEADVLATALVLAEPMEVWRILNRPDVSPAEASKLGTAPKFTGTTITPAQRLFDLKEKVFAWSLEVTTKELDHLTQWLSRQMGLLGGEPEEDGGSEGNALGTEAESSAPGQPPTVPDQEPVG